MVFTTYLLGAQHKRDSVENKLASLVVVPLGKQLKGCLHLYVADRLLGQAVCPSWWCSLTEDEQKGEMRNISKNERSCPYEEEVKISQIRDTTVQKVF